MHENDYIIPSMHDENKAKEIQDVLKRIKGIKDVDTNYEDGVLSVFYDENLIDASYIKEIIAKICPQFENKKLSTQYTLN